MRRVRSDGQLPSTGQLFEQCRHQIVEVFDAMPQRREFDRGPEYGGPTGTGFARDRDPTSGPNVPGDVVAALTPRRTLRPTSRGRAR